MTLLDWVNYFQNIFDEAKIPHHDLSAVSGSRKIREITLEYLCPNRNKYMYFDYDVVNNKLLFCEDELIKETLEKHLKMKIFL